jgi:hypothetical protein
MSNLSYAIVGVLCQVLASVPLGTRRALFVLLWALLSGRFLQSRGAVFPVLAALGLADAEVRRAEAALADGRFCASALVSAWHALAAQQGHWRQHAYEGVRPVACDLSGFYRPHLMKCPTKHYCSHAGKALPALVYGISVRVGSIGPTRLGIARLLLRQLPGETEADLQWRLIKVTAADLTEEEALVADAGFALSQVRRRNCRYVVLMQQNSVARRNKRCAYCGKGRPPQRGEMVRPLARKHGETTIPATPPDATARWKDGRYTLRAHLYTDLVAAYEKPEAEAPFRLMVIFDPRYPKPLVLATNLTVTAHAVWCLYKDRWPVEQLPLAAKQMLGAERSFVFSAEARYRLPELALLAGNVLSYVAATARPIATGSWARCCRPTCGRLRRALERLNFSELPLPEEQLREKASITAHLPTGVAGHRRQKASQRASGTAPAA